MNVKRKFKIVLKFIIFYTQILLSAAQTLLLPIITTEIPFVKETKDCWVYQYYSSTYIIFCKQLVITYLMKNTYELMCLNKVNKFMNEKPIKVYNNIVGKDSLYSYYFYFSVVLFCLFTFFNFLYLV